MAHCNDVLCADQNETITTVEDEANIVGLYTSITIGVDGLPIISYSDITAEALKVAHCNDVACAGPATITTVDNDGNLGGYSLDHHRHRRPADHQLLRHHGRFRRTSIVELSKWRTAMTSHVPGRTRRSRSVDDPATTVGLYTSIAIGGDGLPIISYRDGSLGTHLRVTHCNDVACVLGRDDDYRGSRPMVGSTPRSRSAPTACRHQLPRRQPRLPSRARIERCCVCRN